MAEKHPFINYLETLREDRGALAALRRGLGKPAGTERAMFPYVVPWVPERASRRQEEAYYLIAALFASHPEPGGSGNLGEAFRQTCDPNGDNSAIERRFVALLEAHPDDLPFYLRQAISFLASKEVPVDWNRLFADIQAWDHPDGYVQKQWARGFWGRAAQENEQPKETAPTQQEE